jgi:hypothetical protein
MVLKIWWEKLDMNFMSNIIFLRRVVLKIIESKSLCHVYVSNLCNPVDSYQHLEKYVLSIFRNEESENGEAGLSESLIFFLPDCMVSHPLSTVLTIYVQLMIPLL